MPTEETTLLPPSLTINCVSPNTPPTPAALYEVTGNLFSVPTIGDEVHVLVTASSRFHIGMYLYLSGIGVFKVTAIYSTTVITVENINAVAGTSVAIGTVIQSSGIPYSPEEDNTTPLDFYDTLAQSVEAPGIGGYAEVYVTKGGWFRLGQSLFIEGLGWFRVTNIDGLDSTHCTVLHDPSDERSAMTNIVGSVSAGTPVIHQPPVPFRPDGTSIVSEFDTDGARMSVAPAYVKTPETDSSLIKFGSVEAAAVPTSSYDYLFATVTFGGTAFTAPPNVTITPVPAGTLGGGVIYFGFNVRDITTSGFKIYTHLYTSALTDDVGFNWIAVGA
jgi:hypothetical protein